MFSEPAQENFFGLLVGFFILPENFFVVKGVLAKFFLVIMARGRFLSR